MPAPRAVLTDIEKHGLRHDQAHRASVLSGKSKNKNLNVEVIFELAEEKEITEDVKVSPEPEISCVLEHDEFLQAQLDEPDLDLLPEEQILDEETNEPETVVDNDVSSIKPKKKTNGYKSKNKKR